MRNDEGLSDPIDHFVNIPPIRKVIKRNQWRSCWRAALKSDIAAAIWPHLTEKILIAIRNFDVTGPKFSQKGKELVLQVWVRRVRAPEECSDFEKIASSQSTFQQ